jgi:hypothetical protein
MKSTERTLINQHRPPIDPTEPSDFSDTLRSTQQLKANEALVSRNGLVRLVLEPGGNLVILRQGQATPLWSSQTAGKPVTHAIMRNDGSLACVDGSGKVYWSTPTTGHAGSRVTLQNDGNLVIYSASSTVLWSSNSTATQTQQHQAQFVLEHLACAKTTEMGHDEVYYLLIGKDDSGTKYSHRGPDASQSADADGQTAWDMNDSGDLSSRNFQAVICNESVQPGQTKDFTISFFESDGQDYGSTVRAAGAVASSIGSSVPLVSMLGQVLDKLGSAIPKNQDDTLGSFGITFGNDGGRVVVRDIQAGDYTRVVHPLDASNGTFSMHFQHDDGDYTASFRARGA